MSVDVPSRAPPSLELRIPNATPLEGREGELGQARAALGRRAVVLTGPTGFGKTALALHLAHEQLGESARLGLMVRFDESARGACATVLRDLLTATGLSPGEIKTTLGSGREQASMVVDLADATRPLVVVDDVHHAGADSAAELVRAVVAYGRSARWIFTSELPLPGVEPEHQVALEPLPFQALTALAARWAPRVNETERAAAARAASGSPWRLRERLEGRTLDAPLDAPLAEACARLALLERALPEQLLPIDAATLGALRGRGLLEARGTRWRLHDAVRGSLSTKLDVHDDAVLPLLRRLATSEAGALDAVRLRARRGELEEVRATLDTYGGALLSAGYAPELASLVPVDAPAPLAHWGLRIAAAHGDPAPMRRATEPEPDAPLDARLAWLEVRAACEDHTEVVALAPTLARDADAAARHELACRARLFGAAAAMGLGQLACARDLIDEMLEPTDTQAAHGESVRAMVLAMEGDHATAEAVAERLQTRLDELPAGDRPTLAYNLGIVYHMAKRPLLAKRLLEGLFSDDALAMTSLTGRRALEMYAHFAVLAGDLARARPVLARLRRFAEPDSAPGTRLALAQAQLDLVDGRAGDLERPLAEATARSRALGVPENVAFATQLAAQRALILGGPAPPPCGDRSPSARVADAWCALAAVCHGDETTWEPSAGTDELEDVERLVFVARSLLEHDDPAPARALAPQLEAPLRALPHRLFFAAAAGALRFAAGAGAPTDTSLAADAREIRASLDTLRLAQAGDAAALIALARAGGVWARAVLYEPPGALLGRVARRARRSLRWEAPEGRFDAGGVFVDEARGMLDGPAGSVAAKPSSAALRILRALARSPRGLDKETLCREVWSVDEYHPLRHDNRLRVAVRKLRRRLEPVIPMEDGPVRTTEEGYALVVPLCWMRRASG